MIFNWLRARPPLRLREKVWTESEFHSLLTQLGVQRLRDVDVLLPTTRYFSSIEFASDEDVHCLLNEVGKHLDLDVDHVEFEFVDDGSSFEPCSIQTDETLIQIPSLVLLDPESLIALFIRELCRDFLVREEWLQGHEINHHGVVDLFTVLVGGGVFSANTTLKERNRTDGQWRTSEMWRQAHSPSRIFGYALALFSTIRDERKPLWASYLTPDAMQAWKQGANFLRKSSDCVFNIHDPATALPTSVSALGNRLRQAEPSIRLHALWMLLRSSESAEPALPEIESLLDDPDIVVRETAIDLVGQLGVASEAGKLRIIELIDDRDAEIAASAVNAAAALRIPMRQELQKDRSFGDALAWLLQQDTTPQMLAAVAQAMLVYGSEAQFLAKDLLPALRNSLVRCEDDRVVLFLQALNAVLPDLRSFLGEAFANDSDLLAPIHADIDDIVSGRSS